MEIKLKLFGNVNEHEIWCNEHEMAWKNNAMNKLNWMKWNYMNEWSEITWSENQHNVHDNENQAKSSDITWKGT